MKKQDFFKRYQVKSHQDGKWRNPYFRQIPRRRSRLRWPVLGLIVLLLILLVFFLFAPGFTINRVVVQGNEYIDSHQIEEAAWEQLHERRFLVLPGTNRWLVNENAIREELDAQFVFDSLEIRQEGSTLLISVKERVSSLVWSTAERNYFVDRTGAVTRELMSEEIEATTTGLPQIFDQSNNEVKIGSSILNTNIIQGMFDFINLLGQEGIYIEYLSVESSESQWLLAHTKDNYDILFDPTEEIERQVNNLFVIIRESVEDITQINYVDLRFGDHVYFK
ncbi:hypothetical protein KJ910_04685 [Patescibacteria group bacterium]|nr:hypothetical protein [Patescibacteria group bacterium]MBU1906714.1 hypothetical protein [Patescibacteria group bacterium]